jgi:hypothetical protein
MLLGVTLENGQQHCLEEEHGGARREQDGDIEWCQEGILLLSHEWSVFLPCCMLFPLHFPVATFSRFIFLPLHFHASFSYRLASFPSPLTHL